MGDYNDYCLYIIVETSCVQKVELVGIKWGKWVIWVKNGGKITRFMAFFWKTLKNFLILIRSVKKNLPVTLSAFLGRYQQKLRVIMVIMTQFRPNSEGQFVNFHDILGKQCYKNSDLDILQKLMPGYDTFIP